MENQKPGNTNIFISLVVIAGVIGLLVYYFMKAPERQDEQAPDRAQVPAQETTTEVTTQSKESPTQIKNNTTTTKPMEPTQNRVAKNGDTLVMNYTGRLTNGTVFDSNVDPKFAHVQPFEFRLGAGEVIKGWDEGLLGMKVGEKKTLTIPPEKGYGARGQGPIPPNSTLIFDVELIAIK